MQGSAACTGCANATARLRAALSRIAMPMVTGIG
jgi:hypothetical protein